MSYLSRIEDVERRPETKFCEYTLTAAVSVGPGVLSAAITVPKASLPVGFDVTKLIGISIFYSTTNGIGFTPTSYKIDASGNLVIQCATTSTQSGAKSIKPTVRLVYGV